MNIFLSFLLGIALFNLFLFFPFTSALLCGAAFFYMLRKKQLLAVIFLAMAVLYSIARYTPEADPGKLANRTLLLTGRFPPNTASPVKTRESKTFEIEKAIDEQTGEELGELENRDAYVDTEIDPDTEKEYELLFKTGKDRTRLNPYGYPPSMIKGALIAASAGPEAPLSISGIFKKERVLLNSFILKRFRPDSAALISSITTGEMSFLSEDLKNAFSATGLAHILSISGSHFALFSVMLFGCFMFLILRLPYAKLQRLTLHLTPSQMAAILCFPFMVMYLGLSGAGPPAMRSFVMITLFLSGILLGRKGFWLNSLLFAGFILAAFNPDVILNLSFQLSFLAVLFIGFAVEDKGSGYEEPGPSRVSVFVTDSVKLTIAATLGTFPLVAYHFHYISLISPIANLLAGPLIGFILLPLAVISSFSYLLTGHYLFAPLVGISADLSVRLVRLMSRIPHSSMAFPGFPPVLCILFYTGCIPFILFHKKRLVVLPFLPFVFFLISSSLEKKELRVTFLDVGQGDSAVLELPGGQTVVIDTGRTGKETAAFLKGRGKREIDALILTHSHPDHTGGMSYIADRVGIREVWDNGMLEYPEPEKFPRRTLERGDVIEAGYCRFSVLHPYRGFYTSSENESQEENNSSLVLKVEGRKYSFLFTGDIEAEAEENVSALGKWLKSDVIKIPHHGGKSSENGIFLATVSPSIAMISAGRDNPYGHPNPAVLRDLNGKSIYRTDMSGAIEMTESDQGLRIKTCRDFVLERAGSLQTELRNYKRIFSSW